MPHLPTEYVSQSPHNNCTDEGTQHVGGAKEGGQVGSGACEGHLRGRQRGGGESLRRGEGVRSNEVGVDRW